jgi:hypothetical protein
MIDAVDGLAAELAALGAFMLGQMFIHSGESSKAASAKGTVDFPIFVVVVVGHVAFGVWSQRACSQSVGLVSTRRNM